MQTVYGRRRGMAMEGFFLAKTTVIMAFVRVFWLVSFKCHLFPEYRVIVMPRCGFRVFL
jgi:hypothetical protein